MFFVSILFPPFILVVYSHSIIQNIPFFCSSNMAQEKNTVFFVHLINNNAKANIFLIYYCAFTFAQSIFLIPGNQQRVSEHSVINNNKINVLKFTMRLDDHTYTSYQKPNWSLKCKSTLVRYS